MAYAKAKHIVDGLIPIIDITPLRAGRDTKAVANALHDASQGLGFIYIKGHGIPQAVINNARDSAYQFFRSPEEKKSSVVISNQHRGWLGQGRSKMHDDAKTDLKESFILGGEYNNENLTDDHTLRGQNQWPDFLPEMQSSAMSYFAHSHDVAFHLMRGFALGLDLDESFFLKSCTAPLSRMAYVYYPNQREEHGEQQFGVGPHTDFGVLTVLCQDSVGGLQIETINGEWVHAPPIEGTLIINVGDLLSRWTEGVYKSTPHRVVNSSGGERLSLVFAFDPNPETIIDSQDVFGHSHVSKEPPVTCGDYLNWRFNKAFLYRN
jgi:isopenicillin N synthase-like dioxygenase